jgi:uncharacterized protein YebE (UPF0316 family)
MTTVETLRPVLITALVLLEVALWQWRIVIAHRGRRAAATALGAVGAVLQITAISQVVSGVQDPLSVAAYAVGVGLGVLLGLVVGDRVTPGTVGVTVITTRPDVADRLWSRGWPVTVSSGEGEDGPVTVLFVAVGRRDETRLRQDVLALDAGAFWSTGDVRSREPDLQPV